MTLPRLVRIEGIALEDHFHLSADDECYCFFEYTSGRNWSFSATNGLITNLKKSPAKREKAEYRYKEIEIAQCAHLLQSAINPEWLKSATLVPVPPSKAADHPEYDDRMLRVCCAIHGGVGIDVRPLIRQTASMEAAHVSSQRPSVEDLLEVWEIDEALATPAPSAIAVVDDVLTAGVHYRAAHTLLSNRFPGVALVGFFIARRVFPPLDWEGGVAPGSG